MDTIADNRRVWNRCRFVPGQGQGHYESYFQRANHPTRPLAFWIRYTLFCPRRTPDRAVGELWAIVFDGERDRIVATKEVLPLAQCRFSTSGLDARIGQAVLDADRLEGEARSGGHAIRWTMCYQGSQPPLLLFPRSFYDRGFPKAKALVGTPNAVFQGHLDVDGQRLSVDGWVGSQNHNWGVRHTDHYAWGQVAGFDNAPDAFLECSTARVRVGPFWTPWFTLMVLRLDGREFALNSLYRAIRAHGRFGYFTWTFDSCGSDIHVQGEIHAPASAFVGLRYDNPPGGSKTCLNTKLAHCEVTVKQPGQPPRRLTAAHRAAFEILTDDTDHGVPLVL